MVAAFRLDDFIQQRVMWKIWERHVADIIVFEMPKKLDEIGHAIGNVSWPTMIYVGQLAEEIPVPIRSIRANLERAVKVAQESEQ